VDPTGLEPVSYYNNLGKGGDANYSRYSDGIEPRKQTELPNGEQACRFASLQFGAINSLGLHPLTEKQMVDSKNSLVAQGLVGTNWGTYNKDIEIIESALAEKGLPSSFKTIQLTDPLEIKQLATFSVRNVANAAGTDPGGHYNAGAGDGSLLWDPRDGYTDTGRADNHKTTFYTIVQEVPIIEYGPNGRKETTETVYNPDGAEEYAE
jgi:hypothetical protein